MRLFIQIRDGAPFEHPIQEDNFKFAFPQIDMNNLPEEFMDFERVDQKTELYEVFTEMPYFIDADNVVRNGTKRDMTADEKAAKIQELKDHWEIIGFPSWVFDETTGDFSAPLPYPDQDRKYRWNEDIVNWVEIA
tara:strand:- start:493 stop:897 length:405 start_codon:yes stop_codon:yes gene_type:complete